MIALYLSPILIQTFKTGSFLNIVNLKKLLKKSFIWWPNKSEEEILVQPNNEDEILLKSRNVSGVYGFTAACNLFAQLVRNCIYFQVELIMVTALRIRIATIRISLTPAKQWHTKLSNICFSNRVAMIKHDYYKNL